MPTDAHPPATSFYGIIDLAAILPFYIGLGIDGRTLRSIRLLRLQRASVPPAGIRAGQSIASTCASADATSACGW
jgi:hypothetical protein